MFNYLDDFVVYSRSVEQNAQHVRTVLRLRDEGFTLNPTNMTIGAREVTYLRHCLSSRGISVLPDSGSHPLVSSAYQFEIPVTVYWDGGILCWFCASFYKQAAPLNALKKKGAIFLWTEEHQTALESLKQA